MLPGTKVLRQGKEREQGRMFSQDESERKCKDQNRGLRVSGYFIVFSEEGERILLRRNAEEAVAASNVSTTHSHMEFT